LKLLYAETYFTCTHLCLTSRNYEHLELATDVRLDVTVRF